VIWCLGFCGCGVRWATSPDGRNRGESSGVVGRHGVAVRGLGC